MAGAFRVSRLNRMFFDRQLPVILPDFSQPRNARQKNQAKTFTIIRIFSKWVASWMQRDDSYFDFILVNSPELSEGDESAKYVSRILRASCGRSSTLSTTGKPRGHVVTGPVLQVGFGGTRRLRSLAPWRVRPFDERIFAFKRQRIDWHRLLERNEFNFRLYVFRVDLTRT